MHQQAALLVIVLGCLAVAATGFAPSSKQSFLRRQVGPSLTVLDMTTDLGNHHVMVVGSANQDLTSTTDILPTIGETVMGLDFSTACGGKGANQAVAAASLGFVPVSMVCRVGNDIFGQNLLDNFRKCIYRNENGTLWKKNLLGKCVANISMVCTSVKNFADDIGTVLYLFSLCNRPSWSRIR